MREVQTEELSCSCRLPCLCELPTTCGHREMGPQAGSRICAACVVSRCRTRPSLDMAERTPRLALPDEYRIIRPFGEKLGDSTPSSLVRITALPEPSSSRPTWKRPSRRVV